MFNKIKETTKTVANGVANGVASTSKSVFNGTKEIVNSVSEKVTAVKESKKGNPIPVLNNPKYGNAGAGLKVQGKEIKNLDLFAKTELGILFTNKIQLMHPSKEEGYKYDWSKSEDTDDNKLHHDDERGYFVMIDEQAYGWELDPEIQAVLADISQQIEGFANKPAKFDIPLFKAV